MNCDVCVYQESDSVASFSRETHIAKARKSCLCCECRRPIAAGSPYWKVVGRWDRGLLTFRQCEGCREIQQVFCCDGWVYGDLWEAMEEQAFENLSMSGDCWNALSANAKEFLLEQWRNWKFR